eukprot:1333173-Amorphochlora_amoeboformis.AAC.2
MYVYISAISPIGYPTSRSETASPILGRNPSRLPPLARKSTGQAMFVQRLLRLPDIDLSRAHEQDELRDGISTQKMVGLLTNLNQVSLYASDIFENLSNYSKKISDRLSNASTRMEAMAKVLPSHISAAENPTMDLSEVPSDLFNPVRFRSNLFTPATRTSAIQDKYNKAKEIPPLSLLDEYSTLKDGGTASNGYSNPMYFQKWWIEQQQMEIKMKKAERRKRKIERKKKRADLGSDIKAKTNYHKQSWGEVQKSQVAVEERLVRPEAGGTPAPTMPSDEPEIMDIKIDVTTHQRPASPHSNAQATVVVKASLAPPSVPSHAPSVLHTATTDTDSTQSLISPSGIPAVKRAPTLPGVPPPSGVPAGPSGLPSPRIPPSGIPAPPSGIPAPPAVGAGLPPPPDLGPGLPPPPELGAGLPAPPAMNSGGGGGRSDLLSSIRAGRSLKKSTPVKKEPPPVTGKDAFLAQIRQRKNIKLKKVKVEPKTAPAAPTGGMSEVMKVLQMRTDIAGDDSDDDDDDDDDWE